MIDIQLGKQSSCQVTLIHELFDDHRLLDSSSQPEHRYVMDTRVMSVALGRIVESMIRQTYNKQIIPYWRFADTFYELTQAMVCKCKSIGLLFFQLVIGDFERFMAAQSQKGGMPGGVFPVLQHLVEVIEGNIIVHSPRVLVLAHGEIGIGSKFLITTFQQITFHIGEINVTSIQEVGTIAFFYQFSGDRRQSTALGWYLHYRKVWKALVAAKGTDCTSVGTKAVGIAVGKPDTFFGQTVDVRAGTFYTSQRFYHGSPEPFHQDNQNIRPFGVEQFYGIFPFGGI